MDRENNSFKNLEIIVRHSKYTMDGWDDGDEIRFTIMGSKIINLDDLYDLVSGYLKAVDVEHREFMFRLKEVK